MKLRKPPETPAEFVDRAKTELANGVDADYATAYALIAIAERLGQIAEHLRPVQIAVDADHTPTLNWPDGRVR
ncbi:hypothetical protein [Mycolicibacterium mageritense]|uniref:Uncharacterized protein n=1 Tax=Mycolicibacterium mageritense TaxID=53462 RepID=A0AAI8U1Y4_MYCME|nr:hypothetical protein [Mycolicibacterium mageritense]BDY33179.1 hypothetical protein hbim_07154 [Mycolicibacterium mageritense]